MALLAPSGMTKLRCRAIKVERSNMADQEQQIVDSETIAVLNEIRDRQHEILALFRQFESAGAAVAWRTSPISKPLILFALFVGFAASVVISVFM